VGNARLNESDVVRIKSALTAGRRQSEIARAFHVSQSTVYLIANGKTWRHVQ
jgi:DNA invertase Pin-like site-specific DNA recombinase